MTTRKAAEKAVTNIQEMLKETVLPAEVKHREQGKDREDKGDQKGWTEGENSKEKKEQEVLEEPRPYPRVDTTGDTKESPSLLDPEWSPSLVSDLQDSIDKEWRSHQRFVHKPNESSKVIPLLSNKQVDQLRHELRKNKKAKCPVVNCTAWLGSVQAMAYHIPRCFAGTLKVSDKTCPVCKNFIGTSANLKRHLVTKHPDVAHCLDFDAEYKPESEEVEPRMTASAKWITSLQHREHYRKWTSSKWENGCFQDPDWMPHEDHWTPLAEKDIEEFEGDPQTSPSDVCANNFNLSKITRGGSEFVGGESTLVMNTGLPLLAMDWLPLPPIRQEEPTVTSHTPSTSGDTPQLSDNTPSINNHTPSISSHTPVNNHTPSISSHTPSTTLVSCDQFLALSAVCETVPQSVEATSKGCGVLQLWRVCGSEEGGLVGSQLELCVAYRFGHVRDVKWCPCTAHKPSTENQPLGRLGLLALACGDGYGRILSIPYPRQLSKYHHKGENPTIPLWVKPDVVQVLLSPYPSLSSVSTPEFGTCVCMDWCPADGCTRIMTGFSSGIVCIWDLSTRSPLLSSSPPDHSAVLCVHPLVVIPAHNTVCSAVSWCGGDPSLIATGGYDCKVHIWRTDSPLHPLSTPELHSRGIIKDLCWPAFLKGFLFSSEYFKSPYSVVEKLLVPVKKDVNSYTLVASPAPVTSVSYSPWTCQLATGTFSGATILKNCWGLNKASYGKKKSSFPQKNVLVVTSGDEEKASTIENEAQDISDVNTSTDASKNEEVEENGDSFDFTKSPDFAVMKVLWNSNELYSNWLAVATRTGHVVVMDLS
jgi:WD40 repeat protein